MTDSNDPTPAPAGEAPAQYRVLFDGPPSHESGRFVELEDETGRSISAGEWVEEGPFWVLVLPAPAGERLTEPEDEAPASPAPLSSEERFTIFWQPTLAQYKVSIPRYGGGEVVRAEAHDATVAFWKRRAEEAEMRQFQTQGSAECAIEKLREANERLTEENERLTGERDEAQETNARMIAVVQEMGERLESFAAPLGIVRGWQASERLAEEKRALVEALELLELRLRAHGDSGSAPTYYVMIAWADSARAALKGAE